MISLSASLSSRHDLKWCHPSCCIFSISFCPLKLLQFHIFALVHTSHDLSYWQICLLANCGFEQRELRAKSLDIFAQLAKRLAACWELAKVGAKGDPDKNRVRGDSCCRRWSWWDNSPEWARVVSLDAYKACTTSISSTYTCLSVGWSITLSDFNSVGVYGPSRSALGPWDVKYFLKGMAKNFPPDRKMPT